jgi:hypothetical protein
LDAAETAPRPGVLGTLDRNVLLDSDIAVHTIAGRTHRSAGRSSYTPADQAYREKLQVALPERTHFFEGAVGDDRPGYFAIPGTERAVPWQDLAPGTVPYFFHAHGSPVSTSLHTTRGRTVQVDGTQLGRYLKRRPSLDRLAPEAPVVLVSCSVGDAATAGERTVAQLVADETGRVVFAPNVTTTASLMVAARADGSPGDWLRFEPQRRAPDAGGDASDDDQLTPSRPMVRGPKVTVPNVAVLSPVLAKVTVTYSHQRTSEAARTGSLTVRRAGAGAGGDAVADVVGVAVAEVPTPGPTRAPEPVPAPDPVGTGRESGADDAGTGAGADHRGDRRSGPQ